MWVNMGSSEFNFIIPCVYYLKTQNEGMNPIAIRVELTSPDYISWEDTSNGRILRVNKILMDEKEIDLSSPKPPEKTPDKIVFISTDGESFELVKLTSKIFNEKLKPYVAKGNTTNFTTDDQVQNHYLSTDFYSTR